MAGEAQRFPDTETEGIYMALSHTATCQLSGWRLVRGRKPSTLGQTLSRMFVHRSLAESTDGGLRAPVRR